MIRAIIPPRVSIRPMSLGYDVLVLTDEYPGGGLYGWSAWALTRRGAERVAVRIARLAAHERRRAG